MRLIFFLPLCFFGASLFAQDKQLPNTAGPNCHSLHVAYSENGGNSYNQIANGIISSASVPDAVRFKDENLIYYVNGDFDNHSIYVSEIGERDKDGDGKISRIDKNGNISTFATGLNDPKGIIFFKEKLYVTDRDVIIEVNKNGSWSILGAEMSFPKTPVFLNDIDVDSKGNFYITDTGNLFGALEFSSACMINGIQPIIGTQLEVLSLIHI